MQTGALPKLVETTLSEALVLGLLKQGVRKYLAIFGHGSTDLGEVLRIYEEEGVTRTFNCRNEVEMAHAATALRWQYGETPAVVTSIGPGAHAGLRRLAGRASNGVGVYHIYGDETTFGEGYNMQQVPKEEQGLFGRMTAMMGRSYVLHTPEALRDALRRGALARATIPIAPGRSICCCRSTRSRSALTRQSRRAAGPAGRCRSWRRPTTRRSTQAAALIAKARSGRHQGRRRHARP